jgi:hypothetical protein
MFMENLFKPIRYSSSFNLFLFISPLLAGIIGVFINPAKLDASDFMLIAWNPGQEALTTGSVYAEYPYPLWTVVAMLPFSVWEPPVAMFLWFTCNTLMLSASLAIMLTLFDWKITPALIGILIPLSAFFLPVLSSLWLGQLTIFSLFILVLTVLLFLRERWTWLGVVLGLSFIKPQVMILLAGLILLWAFFHRRWRALVGFGAMIGFLIVISLPFASNAGQIIGGGISSHLGTYLRSTSTIWGLFLTLGFSWIAPATFSIALITWLGWLCMPFLRGEVLSARRVLYYFSVITLVNLVALPYSWMHNLALLLLPFGYCLSLVLKMQGGARAGWLTLLFIVMHPLMDGLFILFSLFTNTQAFQVVPALLLLPMTIFFEYKTTPRIP